MLRDGPNRTEGGLPLFRPGRRKRASACSSRRRRIGACFDPNIARPNPRSLLRRRGRAGDDQGFRPVAIRGGRSGFAPVQAEGGGFEACFGPRPSGWRSGFAPGSTFAARSGFAPVGCRKVEGLKLASARDRRWKIEVRFDSKPRRRRRGLPRDPSRRNRLGGFGLRLEPPGDRCGARACRSPAGSEAGLDAWCETPKGKARAQARTRPTGERREVRFGRA